MAKTCVFVGDELAKYGFPNGHPFSIARYDAFYTALKKSKFNTQYEKCTPQKAEIPLLKLFHTEQYIAKVQHLSKVGSDYLDAGDTPVFPGIFTAAATVVGTTIAAADAVMQKKCMHAFNPIGGLHHARPEMASGFCVFNDCGVVIEYLRSKYDVQKILYVDIDAHHGDGVFYSYEDDEDIIILDFHQDSRTLYPGTGKSFEIGRGSAKGTKLNIEMLPGSRDKDFLKQWEEAEIFLSQFKYDFILLQCGVDSLQGDPITNLHYSEATHKFVTQQLIKLANQYCGGKFLAMGGGGYNLTNISKGWVAVTEAMLNA